MPKMIFFCRRRPDIDHDAYAHMVLSDHVPLALRHHPTMTKYVVNVVDRVPNGEPAYDSVAELTFDQPADYQQRLYDSPEGEELIRRDVARFMGTVHAYTASEHVHRELAEPAPLGSAHQVVKMVCPIRRKDELSHREFVDHWLHRHRPLALRRHPGLIRYVANVVDQAMAADTPRLDGVGELYFADMRSLRDSMYDSAEGRDEIARDIDRFIGHTTGYLATEYVQKRP